MGRVSVVFDFIRCPYAEKIAKGRNIYMMMNGNPNFPSPDTELSTLKTSTDKLEKYYLASQSRSKEATAKLHKEVKVWIEIMRQEARYVERMSDDVVSVLLSSGFNLAKPPIPGSRSLLIAKSGTKRGSVFLRRKAVQKACSYIWQYCIDVMPENEKDWTFANVTVQASCELTGLIQVTRYWFRVAVVTTKGISAYCNPIMHVVK